MPHRRPNRSAAERRAQASRAEARAIQRIVKALQSLEEHRGCRMTKLGRALHATLTGDTGGHAVATDDPQTLHATSAEKKHYRMKGSTPFSKLLQKHAGKMGSDVQLTLFGDKRALDPGATPDMRGVQDGALLFCTDMA